MQVRILASPGTPSLDLAGPMEVFSEAAQEVGEQRTCEAADCGFCAR